MNQTASGEAHKLRLHVRQKLGKIRSHAVLAAKKGIHREQGDHVQVQFACPLRNNGQPSAEICSAGLQHGFVLLPSASSYGDMRLGVSFP
ncbi:hypothetical protein D3C76_1651730 [compost metagenome]